MGTFAIDITEHHWLAHVDPEQDLCSHGRVFVRVDGQPFVSPDDGEFTLSATALYLLRTLEQDHSPENQVGDHLLPCCGHVLIAPSEGSTDVLVLGCPSGIDWSVSHQRNSVRLHDLRGHPALDGARSVNATIPVEQYRETVAEFASAVWSLFAGSPKRITDSEDRRGYATFNEEFQRRLRLATTSFQARETDT